MDGRDINPGMVVRSADGERLGRVCSLGAESFHIEKGLFFRQDYEVSYAELRAVENGELILAHGRQALRAAIRHERTSLPLQDVEPEREVDVVEELQPLGAPLETREIGALQLELRHAAGPVELDGEELSAGLGDPLVPELGEAGDLEPKPLDPRRTAVADEEEVRLRSPFSEEFDPFIRR